MQGSVALFTAFAPVFDRLGREPRFVDAVALRLACLKQRSVLATLEALP